jgi:hypothetical protein
VIVFRLILKKVIPLNPTLKLLKAKRSSALKAARKMEVQLARLNKKAEPAGSPTNISYIVGMFHDYIATLDEAIKSSHTPRRRKNSFLWVDDCPYWG